jgi:integrase
LWWGRWDLNPGSPAPQAGILIQTPRNSLRIPENSVELSKLDDDPALQEYKGKVLKTIQELKANGLSRNTIKSVIQTLRTLNRETDLMNPEAVKICISELKKRNHKNEKTNETLSNQSKQKHINNYAYFAEANNIQWEKTIYKWDTKVPITPSREQAEAIIASAPTLNSATIFRILLDSGFEGQELHNTTRKDVDTEQGIITVAGTKGHRGRSYKFKASTAEMLRIYILKHNREHPFPRPNVMGDAWRGARERASAKLSRPDLLNIPLKGLRNLSGILLWQKFPDPWRIMLHMGHKKLDTTQHYLSAMTAQNTEIEWICKTATTPQERIQLIEQGFTLVEKDENVSYYRKAN